MIDPKVKGPRGWRPILAHHTTTACQPRKQTGTIDSLIVGGLDEVTWRNNQFEVTTLLPNAFADGDRISIEAVGSSTNKKGAKEDCVQKLMSLLLAIGPEKVHLHTSFFPTGGDGIQLLVDEAWKAHLDLFDWDTSPLNEAQFSLIEVMVRGPKPRSRPLATCRARKEALAHYYQRVAESQQGDRNEEIVQFLSRLCRERGGKGNRGGIFWTNKVPEAQRNELMRRLPPRSLKPFVLARPNLFEIVENNAQQGAWGIRMTRWATHWDTSSPAVGGSSASTHGPASAIPSGPPGAASQATASQGTIPPVGGSEGTIPASQPAEEPRPQVPAWFQGWTGNGVSNDQDNEYNDWVGWHHWQENEWRGRGWRWY